MEMVIQPPGNADFGRGERGRNDFTVQSREHFQAPIVQTFRGDIWVGDALEKIFRTFVEW
jgi:hypothetical protein